MLFKFLLKLAFEAETGGSSGGAPAVNPGATGGTTGTPSNSAAGSDPSPGQGVGQGQNPASPAPKSKPEGPSLVSIQEEAFKRGMKSYGDRMGKPSEPESSEVAKSFSQRAQDRTRDPSSGKFTQGQPAEPAAKAADPATPTAQTIESKAVVDIPSGYPEGAAPFFAKAPPELQQFLVAREQQYDEVFKQIQPVIDFGSRIGEVVARNQDYFEERPDVTPEVVLSNYLNFDRLVATNPAAAIIQLAAQTNINLVDLITAISEGKFNPREALLEHSNTLQKNETTWERNQRIENEKAEQQRKENDQNQRAQNQQNQQQQKFKSVVEKASAGLPDWAELEDDIATLLPSVIRQNPKMTPEQQITEAHSRARRANPKTFAKIQLSARATSEKQVAEARERAENAKLASDLNVSGNTIGGGKSLREAQDAAYNRGMQRSASRG